MKYTKQEKIDKLMELIKEHSDLDNQQSEIRNEIDSLLDKTHKEKLWEDHTENNAESFTTDDGTIQWYDEFTFPDFIGRCLIDYLADLETEEEE